MKKIIDETIEKIEIPKNISGICSEEFYENLEYNEYSVEV